MKHDESELFRRLAAADGQSAWDAEAMVSRVIATHSQRRRRRRAVLAGGVGVLALALLTASLLPDSAPETTAKRVGSERTESIGALDQTDQHTLDSIDAMLAEMRHREEIDLLRQRIEIARASTTARQKEHNLQMLAYYQAKHGGEIAVPDARQLYSSITGN